MYRLIHRAKLSGACGRINSVSLVVAHNAEGGRQRFYRRRSEVQRGCEYIYINSYRFVCIRVLINRRFFAFYPGGSAVWPQCWLCAVCAVGRVGCCVGEG